MSPPTADRVMVVTGASSGIGRALALTAARQHFGIVAVARRADRLRELVAEIEAEGCSAIALPLDICDRQSPGRIVQAARTRFDRIDVLVHNAGSGSPGNLLAQSDAAIEAQWQLHVGAPLRITRSALPMLQRSNGQVIFIGSGAARLPPPGFGAYCAAKAAMRAAAAQLRRELHSTRVAVTYVDPGTVDTEWSQAAGMRRRAPKWLLLKPERVAERIMAAIRSRPRTVHAGFLHAAAVSIGEAFPFLADAVMPAVTDTPRESGPEAQAAAPPEQELDFERALQPVAHRMERVKLPREFLASLLEPGSEIQLSDAAMRWAGMPNKNERAAMAEALDALSAAGFLRRTSPESWEVLRSP